MSNLEIRASYFVMLDEHNARSRTEHNGIGTALQKCRVAALAACVAELLLRSVRSVVKASVRVVPRVSQLLCLRSTPYKVRSYRAIALAKGLHFPFYMIIRVTLSGRRISRPPWKVPLPERPTNMLWLIVY